MAIRVQLDRSRCQGHGRCYVLAATVFESDDDGYGAVISETLSTGLEDLAHKGAGNCPEDAITIIED